MAALGAALKAYRLQEAKKIEKPAFTVFSNKVLDAIVERSPQTAAQLLSVKGMGPGDPWQFLAGLVLRLCGKPLPAILEK